MTAAPSLLCLNSNFSPQEPDLTGFHKKNPELVQAFIETPVVQRIMCAVSHIYDLRTDLL